MKYLVSITLFLLLISCKSEDKPTSPTVDPVLEQIAGKDYAEMIRIPTTADGDVDSLKMARIYFETTSFSFDTIFAGDRITHEFSFRNEGVQALYILQTNSSCGCTVMEYSREPVAPGASGSIRVVFDSTGKKGRQLRKVSVLTNAYPSEKVLTLTGFVKQKES